jgi:peptide-methionine (S)-S-oxide reductase
MTTFTLAGGCFWCLDAVFRNLRGVTSSIVGYAGGSKADADYYRVASGQTAHAESVQVRFDESILPVDVLLDIFFTLHDPTTLNRQGADVGPQYRSAMFYEDDTQREQFESARTRAAAIWDKPIVTEITKLDEFYTAESEHQDYYAQNPANPYCAVVIDPKIVKVRHSFASYFVT